MTAVTAGLADEVQRLRGQLDERDNRLRAVRRVCEQLGRTADDTDPRHNPVIPLDYADRHVDVATAKAIWSCVAAVTGALAGAGHEPRIPAPRDHHDQAAASTGSGQ